MYKKPKMVSLTLKRTINEIFYYNNGFYLGCTLCPKKHCTDIY